jgi:hypothetical protein
MIYEECTKYEVILRSALIEILSHQVLVYQLLTRYEPYDGIKDSKRTSWRYFNLKLS